MFGEDLLTFWQQSISAHRKKKINTLCTNSSQPLRTNLPSLHQHSGNERTLAGGEICAVGHFVIINMKMITAVNSKFTDYSLK